MHKCGGPKYLQMVQCEITTAAELWGSLCISRKQNQNGHLMGLKQQG